MAVLLGSFSAQADDPAKELRAKYLKFDFSEALKPKTEFLGYTGSSYQRLKITFTSVTKDASVASVYQLKGHSLVREKKCEFVGTLKIDRIKELKNADNPADSELKDAGIKAEGNLKATYDIEEEPARQACGHFHGTMTLNWYVDDGGRIRYDDLESGVSDGFKNNQYEGTWTPHSKKAERAANWGEYRIPQSGDLDKGAAEFSVNPKYLKRGWENAEP